MAIPGYQNETYESLFPIHLLVKHTKKLQSDTVNPEPPCPIHVALIWH